MTTLRKVLGLTFTVISRFIAVLLAALTVFAAILALLLSGMQHTLFKAGTYQRALREEKVYAQLPALLAEQQPQIKAWLLGPCGGDPLACSAEKTAPEIQDCLLKYLGNEILTDIASGKRKPTPAETQTAQDCVDEVAARAPRLSRGGLALLKDLTSAQWDALLTHLLPADVAQKLTETSLSSALAYFKGEVAAARLPLASLKARLTGKPGVELVTLLLKSTPACTKEQQVQIDAGRFGVDEAPPIYCAAEGETSRKLSAELQRRFDQAASELPEAAVLIDPPPDSDPMPGLNLLGNNPQVVRQRIYIGIRFSPLLVIGLLLLVALFGVRSLRGWLRWWGVPLFIAGIITLVISIASQLLFSWAWGRYVDPAIPASVGQTLTELGKALAHSLVNDLAPWLVLESGILALLALGLLMLSTRVPPPPNRSLPPLAPPGTPGGPVLIQPKSKRKGKRK